MDINHQNDDQLRLKEAQQSVHIMGESTIIKINITKQALKQIQECIEGKFENDSVLLYYLNINTLIQNQSGQIKIFKLMNKSHGMSYVAIINYELHQKGIHQNELYGIIKSNNNCNWVFHGMLTHGIIQKKYAITNKQLPKASRQKASFKRQLIKPQFTMNIMNNTDWFNISYNNGTQNSRVKLSIWRERWIQECNNSIQNANLPILPIIVADDKTHWIEWIKPIYIESHDIYVALQCGYDQQALSLMLLWLKRESEVILSEDLIILIMQFYVELNVKSLCPNPKYVECAHGAVGSSNSILFDGMKDYDKWVTDIIIHDFESIVKLACTKYDIDYNKVKQCFDEYDIDYEYLKNHTRRDFIQLLREYNVKVGEAYNIWKELHEQNIDEEIALNVSKSMNSHLDECISTQYLFFQIIDAERAKKYSTH